jgi:Holliday junction resolvase-like predicted endonuclease
VEVALPREQVNPKKQRRIALAAVAFISFHNIRGKDFRFDIVEVHLDHHGEPARLEHLEHAFDLPRGLFI